jgi:hypothetical protein
MYLQHVHINLYLGKGPLRPRVVLVTFLDNVKEGVLVPLLVGLQLTSRSDLWLHFIAIFVKLLGWFLIDERNFAGFFHLRFWRRGVYLVHDFAVPLVVLVQNYLLLLF